MLKNQRHSEILEILRSDSFAGVCDLATRLYASPSTIRRDLDYLEKKGYVRRSHGGAVLADGKNNTPVPFRRGRMTREKTDICRLAATLVSEGQVLFVDGSTTALCLADFLRSDHGLTVVTNGLPLCLRLSEKKIRTFSTGGRLIGESEAFVGRIAESTAQEFFADLMFFSSSSLGDGGEISDYSEEETALRAVMRGNSRKTVFLCDSGKRSERSAFRLTSLSAVDYFVTDKPLPEDLCHASGLVLKTAHSSALLYERPEASKTTEGAPR